MIYLVHTLKQLWEKTMNTDFVIEADDESNVKALMNKSKIIVLWITPVPGWPKSGQFFSKLEDEGKKFTCCIAADTIEHACERCIIMGLPIISIQNKAGSVGDTESNNLISTYKSLHESKKEAEKQQKEKEKEKKEKVMDSERQKRVIEIIGQTINDIATITEENKENAAFIWELRQLTEYKELLTKMKMGSNTEKSTQILEKVFEIMEKIELTNINEMKIKEEQISDYSIVSNVDIMGELEKLKRAKQTNEAGMRKSGSDIYYTLFWIVWLYQKFIAKDIFNKLSKIQRIFSWIVFYSNFWLVCTSLIISIYIVWLSYHSTINEHHAQYLYALITLGISWVLRTLLLSLKNSNIILIIIWIILAIISIIIIQRLLLVNLALF